MTTDESAFSVPDDLRALIHPRRSGHVGGIVAPPAPDAAARAADLADRHRDAVVALLAAKRADPEVVEQVASVLDGRAGADPIAVGRWAAAVGEVARGEPDAAFVALVDSWVDEHGLDWAAAASLMAFATETTPLARRVSPGADAWRDAPGVLLARVRALLGGADDLQRQRAKERIDPLPDREWTMGTASAFLLPEVGPWVAEVVQRIGYDWDTVDQSAAVLATLHAPAHVDRVDRVLTNGWWKYPSPVSSRSVPIDLVDGLGVEAVAVLVRWVDRDDLSVEQRAWLAEALACVPTDEAFTALVARHDRAEVLPALATAVASFPSRAARIGAAAATQARSAVVAAMLDGSFTLPDPPPRPAPAAEADVPALLREPPWTRPKPKRTTKPLDLDGPTGGAVAWEPGEREAWSALPLHRAWGTAPTMATVGPRAPNDPYAAKWLTEPDALLIASAPTAEAAPLLATWRPEHGISSLAALQRIVAAHPDAAIDLALELIGRSPKDLHLALGPVESPEAVDLAVRWTTRRTLRATGWAWLRRHAGYAAAVLVPRAVGKATAAQRQAGAVLRALLGDGHGDAVRAAAVGHGPAAEAALEVVLATDPVDLLPRTIPVPPRWVDVAALPPLLTPQGTAVPDDAVAALVTMVRLSQPADPYAGLARVTAELDPASCAEVAWALCEQWRAAGAPTGDAWVFEALAALGDDTTVARLLKGVRRDSPDPRALSALDAIVGIGSPAALLALKEVTEKVRTKRVKAGAAARLGEVAERLGLTTDQLADRLVPDLDLDADGTTVLDFGPRRFVVSFDEQLRPVVRSAEDGSRLKALPKPGARDDADRAAAATARFKDLRKQAKALGADQVRRLERAMATERRFTVEELVDVFVDHPLRWHVTRRLVWATFAAEEPGATCTGSFRVDEDRTLVDVDDQPVTLAADAVVGVAHPLHLGADAARWGDVLVDYELLQPFAQLGREVHALPPELVAASSVDDAVGQTIESTRLLGLERRGWPRPSTEDGGMMWSWARPLPTGTFTVVVSPGVYAGDPMMEPTQRIESAALSGGLTFGDLGAVLASEVLADLAWLRS